MKITEYNYKPEFINLLLNILDSKGIRNQYNLNHTAKYNIDYIADVIIAISIKSYTRFRLPNDLAAFLGQSTYSKCSRKYLKSLIKLQLTSNTDSSFFDTYVVIGYDVPVTIKELVVVC
jgi:hypothetical protein